MRSLKLAEAGKARLVQTYDEQAAAAYTKVAVEHSASPHVEDASARLAAMNLPIPTPTPEQAAASVALENSRRSYRLQDRAKLMMLRIGQRRPALPGRPHHGGAAGDHPLCPVLPGVRSSAGFSRATRRCPRPR